MSALSSLAIWVHDKLSSYRDRRRDRPKLLQDCYDTLNRMKEANRACRNRKNRFNFAAFDTACAALQKHIHDGADVDFVGTDWENRYEELKASLVQSYDTLRQQYWGPGVIEVFILLLGVLCLCTAVTGSRFTMERQASFDINFVGAPLSAAFILWFAVTYCVPPRCGDWLLRPCLALRNWIAKLCSSCKKNRDRAAPKQPHRISSGSTAN